MRPPKAGVATSTRSRVTGVGEVLTEDAARVSEEPQELRPVPVRTLDDRWPDRFAAVMYTFAAFSVAVSWISGMPF